jgi:hypothetical protein
LAKKGEMPVAGSIVIRKLSKWQQLGPVVLLITAIQLEVLFESLVYTFGLTVASGMITQGEMQIHIESLAKGTEKVRNKF